MKILIQWALQNPTDWIQIDSSQWSSLSKKPEPRNPRGTDVVDNNPGWIYAINIQGVIFNSDHYVVEDLTGSDGVKVTVWNDDLEDFPEGEKYAQVWTFLPLQPDLNLGGAMNTKQSQIIYAQPLAVARMINPRPWENFIMPSQNVLHGIWVDDILAEAHKTIASLKGWRNWGEHLPPSELDESGKVKIQRELGRYKRRTD